MNITLGQLTTGDKFYIREKLIKKLWKKIESNNNILMSAPRRIGKTSIMHYCMENPKPNYTAIYIITESVNNQNEFYRKMVKVIYDKLDNSAKAKNIFKNIFDSKNIKSIGPKGFSFEQQEIDYTQDFINIVEQLDLSEHKLVLMIDEFAQTVENIIQDEGKSEAIKFLGSIHELRMNPNIITKMQFVFAGSIGLENIVAQLNATNTISDLDAFKVPPFSKEEATEYIKTIALKSQPYIFDDSDINYLLDKLEWHTPYFINILLSEIEEICDDNETQQINQEMIDQVFLNALKKRSYFEHWHIRLRKSYKKENYNFSKEILNKIASEGAITKAETLNIAIGLKTQDTYKDIMNALVYDGYIYMPDNNTQYVFNSPLLKQWWFNNVTN